MFCSASVPPTATGFKLQILDANGALIYPNIFFFVHILECNQTSAHAVTVYCSFDLFASTEKLIQCAYVLACPAPMTDGSASHEILSQALSTLK